VRLPPLHQPIAAIIASANSGVFTSRAPHRSGEGSEPRRGWDGAARPGSCNHRVRLPPLHQPIAAIIASANSGVFNSRAPSSVGRRL
jgi:hypothetical protein